MRIEIFLFTLLVCVLDQYETLTTENNSNFLSGDNHAPKTGTSTKAEDESTITKPTYDKNTIDNVVSRIDETRLKEEKKHVLMYHPWGTKSHRGQQNALIYGLLSKGHSVTGIFPEKSNLIHENYTEIVIDTRCVNITYGV